MIELKAQSMGDMTGSYHSLFFTVQPCVNMCEYMIFICICILLTMQPFTTTTGQISFLNRSRVEVPVKWLVGLLCHSLCCLFQDIAGFSFQLVICILML
jgi:hypothetical protein